MGVLHYIVEHWVSITAVLVGLAGLIISPVVWYRTMRERAEGAEIQTIAKNNAVMRAEFAEMNREMSEHRQRIRTLEILVLEKELSEKRLIQEIEDLKKNLKKKEARESQLINETSKLTRLLEKCRNCTDGN